MAKDYHLLLQELGIVPKNDLLYEAAFTHVSYYNEHPLTSRGQYDRLEFVGDAVLDLVVGDMIYSRFPEMNSGELSKCRAALVRGATLSSFSKRMHFEEYIRVSKGIEKEGTIRPNILEDVFEAFIGAYYLDHKNDFPLTQKLVRSFFADPISHYEDYEHFDYKSKLQELVQEDVKTGVEYTVVREEGMPNQKHFTVQVKVNGIVLGEGEGSSKKRAEMAAAKAALEKKVN